MMGAMHTNLFASLRCVIRLWVRADAGKDQRGLMGIPWIFFHTQQTFRKYCVCIRKLCKYLGAPANINEVTVAICKSCESLKEFHTSKNDQILNFREPQLFVIIRQIFILMTGRNTNTSTPIRIRDPVQDTRSWAALVL